MKKTLIAIAFTIISFVVKAQSFDGAILGVTLGQDEREAIYAIETLFKKVKHTPDGSLLIDSPTADSLSYTNAKFYFSDEELMKVKMSKSFEHSLSNGISWNEARKSQNAFAVECIKRMTAHYGVPNSKLSNGIMWKSDKYMVSVSSTETGGEAAGTCYINVIYQKVTF